MSCKTHKTESLSGLSHRKVTPDFRKGYSVLKCRLCLTVHPQSSNFLLPKPVPMYTLVICQWTTHALSVCSSISLSCLYSSSSSFKGNTSLEGPVLCLKLATSPMACKIYYSYMTLTVKGPYLKAEVVEEVKGWLGWVGPQQPTK